MELATQSLGIILDVIKYLERRQKEARYAAKIARTVMFNAWEKYAWWAWKKMKFQGLCRKCNPPPLA